MANRSAGQIKKMTGMAKAVVKHHFGLMPKKIEHKPAGLTNFVFEINIKEGDFIIRISHQPSKINDYIKEQWAVNHVREIKVPVAEILEVGNSVIPFPYMIQRKLDGGDAIHHPDRLDILRQMGEYAALINTISTTDFGEVFDWSENKLSKNATWKEYLANEIDVANRLQILQKHKMLSTSNYRKLVTQLGKIEKWKDRPVLNHGDMRLKNVIINSKSKIIAIIDWENCCSNIAPYWELSLALHDLNIDEKQAFFEGYGLSSEDYMRKAFSLKAFNIINYAPTIEKFAARKDKTSLEMYRLRLNGYFGLF